MLGLPRRTTRRNPPASLTSRGTPNSTRDILFSCRLLSPPFRPHVHPSRSKDPAHISSTAKSPNPLRRIGAFIPKPDGEPAPRSTRNAPRPPSPSEGHQHLGAGQVSWLAAYLTLCAFPSNQFWVSGVRVSGSKTQNSKLETQNFAFGRWRSADLNAAYSCGAATAWPSTLQVQGFTVFPVSAVGGPSPTLTLVGRGLSILPPRQCQENKRHPARCGVPFGPRSSPKRY